MGADTNTIVCGLDLIYFVAAFNLSGAVDIFVEVVADTSACVGTMATRPCTYSSFNARLLGSIGRHIPAGGRIEPPQP